MRRLAIILCGVCLLAVTPKAHAQAGPGGIFNALTSPIRGVFGILDGARPRRAHRRSAKRSRTVQQKPAPATVAAPAAAGAAAVATAPSSPAASPAPELKPSISAVAPAETKPQTPANEPAKTENAKIDPAKAEPAKTEASKAETAKAGEPKAYWPGAHEDLIGYIFWPRDYDDKLWAHGFSEILSAVFVPAVTRTASVSGAADAPTPADASKLCGPDDSADWPNGRVAETLQGIIGDGTPPTDAQREAIKGLQTALGDAMKAVRSACTDIVNAAPAARMQTMLDRLWAIRVAGYLVREPLKKFYGSLDREQKAKFERGIPGKDALDVCAAASTARIPFPLLARTIRVTADQRKGLATLERKVEQASASLRASCPLKPPATPIARLDAALDRVDAITYAAGNLAPAFGEFYSSLSDDQRTKLSQLAR